MDKALFNIIFAISFSIFVALFSGIYAYTKLSTSFKILFYYTVFATLSNAVTSIMSMKGINNIFLINISSLIEYMMLSLFFLLSVKTRKKLIYLYLFSVLIVSLVFIIGVFRDYKAFNNELKVLVSTIMVLMSTTFLISQFRKADLKINSKPIITVTIGTFTYYASSFLILLLGSDNNYISETEMLWIYFIHSIFYLIFVISLTSAFLQCMKQSDHSNLY